MIRYQSRASIDGLVEVQTTNSVRDVRASGFGYRVIAGLLVPLSLAYYLILPPKASADNVVVPTTAETQSAQPYKPTIRALAIEGRGEDWYKYPEFPNPDFQSVKPAHPGEKSKFAMGGAGSTTIYVGDPDLNDANPLLDVATLRLGTALAKIPAASEFGDKATQALYIKGLFAKAIQQTGLHKLDYQLASDIFWAAFTGDELKLDRLYAQLPAKQQDALPKAVRDTLEGRIEGYRIVRVNFTDRLEPGLRELRRTAFNLGIIVGGYGIAAKLMGLWPFAKKAAAPASAIRPAPAAPKVPKFGGGGG